MFILPQGLLFVLLFLPACISKGIGKKKKKKKKEFSYSTQRQGFQSYTIVFFSADHASDTISRGANTRDSGFQSAYFIKEEFSHLNITALVKRVVEDSLSCAFSCLNNQACFSFNFADFPDKAGKFTCEILPTDKYYNSKNFLPSKTFHHFSVVVKKISLNFGKPECWIVKRY